MGHWYGWSVEEIENLSGEDFSAFLLAIDVLESREVLRSCKANDWPNLKQKDRAKTLKELQKSANPTHKPKKLTTKDLAKMVGASSGR